MPEDSNPTNPGNGLPEQFQALANQLRGEDGHPREIAAWMLKAGDEPI
jgi:hypothetical protein